jgi:hypothetical protein
MNDVKRAQAEALDRCLDRIHSGGAVLEECLRDQAAMVEGLSPLLKTALRSKNALAPEGPSEAFASQSRVRLMRVLGNRAAALHRQQRARWPIRLGRPVAVLASLALVVVLLAGATGVAWASADALPGDPLYAVKRGIEGVRLALTTSPATQAALLEEFAGRRLSEAEELVRSGEEEAFQAPLADYDETIARLLALVESVPGEQGPNSVEQVQQSLARHLEILQRIQAHASPAAQAALERAIERSLERQQAIRNHGRRNQATDEPSEGRKRSEPRPERTPEPHGLGHRQTRTPGKPPWAGH